MPVSYFNDSNRVSVTSWSQMDFSETSRINPLPTLRVGRQGLVSIDGAIYYLLTHLVSLAIRGEIGNDLLN